jgi:hypothetical protein
MRKQPWLVLFLVLGILAGLLPAGCGGDGQSGTAASGGATGGSGGSCELDCGQGGSGAGVIPQGTLIILPAGAMLDVAPGNVPTLAFTATLEGKDVTASVVWLFDRPDIGDIGADALFVPTGNAGGTGKLVGRTSNAEGSTEVTVSAKKVVDGAGLTPQQVAELESPTGPDDASLQIVYPYNETVFPLGVLAPEMQWNGTDAGDVYRLHFQEKFFEYTEYFTAPPPSRHLLGQTEWDNIERSGAGAKGDPLAVSLTRLPASGVAYKPVVHTWHIAQGRLHGSVYYWELPDPGCNNGAAGRILRIKPDSTQIDEFFKPGVCWGCHTVSRDGKAMMAAFDAGTTEQIQQTIDLDKTPADFGSITGPGLVGTFSAYNHTGDKLLVSGDNQTNPASAMLRIVKASNGEVLNPNALGIGCGEPAWSPSGDKIAGICKLGSGGPWVFNAKQGELVVGDVAADGFTVTGGLTIVPQAGQQGRPSFPSFSPGSEWLTFARTTVGATSQGFGNLWTIRPDGTNIRQLAAASSENKSYYPVFAPLRAGGYFWIVFISKRDYGNSLVGASRQQLWITAVDDPATADDPSHPAFYMRGQELCGKSESAYYALDPCKKLGADCQSGVDCCNGQCVKDKETGKYTCGEPPPPGACSQDGNSCKTDADCCDSMSPCMDGFCEPPPPE